MSITSIIEQPNGSSVTIAGDWVDDSSNHWPSLLGLPLLGMKLTLSIRGSAPSTTTSLSWSQGPQGTREHPRPVAGHGI